MAEAQTMARPLAGGAKVKCGAVLGAEAVLRGKYPESLAEKKVREFEEAFTSMNGSLNCRELRGLAGGRRLRSCSGCVSDSAEILEKLL